MFAGVTIVDTVGGYRVLETSHPPNYYVPARRHLGGLPDPGTAGLVLRVEGRWPTTTTSPWGRRWRRPPLGVRRTRAPRSTPSLASWRSIPLPWTVACWVTEEVQPQPGGFYGGWITANLVGPFKGDPGTQGW